MASAIDPSTDPCVDFYKHVCGKWEEQGNMFSTPEIKYVTYHTRETLRELLLQDVSASANNIRTKVVLMLKKCGRESNVEGSLRAFLRSLNLDWPRKSKVNRLQLLDVLVGSSMDYSVPAMWSFMIGRDPMRPRHNIIYLTLDSSVNIWMRHLKQLTASRTIQKYLRRCAEIVGGTGQSYGLMIHDVLLLSRYDCFFLLKQPFNVYCLLFCLCGERPVILCFRYFARVFLASRS